MVQHPVLAEVGEAARQVQMTIDACMETGLPTYIIYPNSDHGYTGIVNTIEAFRERAVICKNLDRDDYLALLKNCTFLIGNSSSGILEAPSFKVPVINIGNRQRGRPQAKNIINADYTIKSIQEAIKIACSKEFLKKAKAAVNPYGDGFSSSRICAILRDIEINQKLLDKACTY